ncbi:hypothetical protein HKX48_004857 [Thoreauomyces humboldtii]|nr:hypothetical protein HKX48_004857 [Thoreauomyces humboldtii]
MTSVSADLMAWPFMAGHSEMQGPPWGLPDLEPGSPASNSHSDHSRTPSPVSDDFLMSGIFTQFRDAAGNLYVGQPLYSPPPSTFAGDLGVDPRLMGTDLSEPFSPVYHLQGGPKPQSDMFGLAATDVQSIFPSPPNTAAVAPPADWKMDSLMSGDSLSAPFLMPLAQTSQSHLNTFAAPVDMTAAAVAAEALVQNLAAQLQNQPQQPQQKDKTSPAVPKAVPQSTMELKSEQKPDAVPLTKAQRKRIREITRNLTCFNCATHHTPLWRRTADKQHSLCNACGLYFKQYQCHRPLSISQRAAAVSAGTSVAPTGAVLGSTELVSTARPRKESIDVPRKRQRTEHAAQPAAQVLSVSTPAIMPVIAPSRVPVVSAPATIAAPVAAGLCTLPPARARALLAKLEEQVAVLKRHLEDASNA